MKEVICDYCGKFMYSEPENAEKFIIVDNKGKLRTFNEELNLTFCSMECMDEYIKEKKR